MSAWSAPLAACCYRSRLQRPMVAAHRHLAVPADNNNSTVVAQAAAVMAAQAAHSGPRPGPAHTHHAGQEHRLLHNRLQAPPEPSMPAGRVAVHTLPTRTVAERVADSPVRACFVMETVSMAAVCTVADAGVWVTDTTPRRQAGLHLPLLQRPVQMTRVQLHHPHTRQVPQR